MFKSTQVKTYLTMETATVMVHYTHTHTHTHRPGDEAKVHTGM